MDGRSQQDAHECFSIFLDILHDGIQYTLFDDGGITDGIASIKKELFSSMASVEYDCTMCGTLTNHIQTQSIRMFYLKPKKLFHIQIDSGLISSVTLKKV